jgi:hypothetical protein
MKTTTGILIPKTGIEGTAIKLTSLAKPAASPATLDYRLRQQWQCFEVHSSLYNTA